jgi:hypothetical protein
VGSPAMIGFVLGVSIAIIRGGAGCRATLGAIAPARPTPAALGEIRFGKKSTRGVKCLRVRMEQFLGKVTTMRSWLDDTLPGVGSGMRPIRRDGDTGSEL